MKAIIIFATMILMALPSMAQEPELSPREMRKLERELKKEQKEKEEAEKKEMVDLMVKHGRFVLEADRLRDRRGNTAIVSPMINFVAADSTSGVLQIGSDRYVGLNGVGGITVDGSISSYEYSYRKKSESYYVSYNLRTPSGTYDVRITVYSDGRADATVTSSWPGRLNYTGYLVPPALSRVYQGMSY